MSDKSDISEVATNFFHLWQKQVSLAAQSPDAGFDALIEEGRKIASAMQEFQPSVPETNDTEVTGKDGDDLS